MQDKVTAHAHPNTGFIEMLRTNRLGAKGYKMRHRGAQGVQRYGID